MRRHSALAALALVTLCAGCGPSSPAPVTRATTVAASQCVWGTGTGDVVFTGSDYQTRCQEFASAFTHSATGISGAYESTPGNSTPVCVLGKDDTHANVFGPEGTATGASDICAELQNLGYTPGV